MKSSLFLCLSILPVSGQFWVPDSRGKEGSSHAEWNVFTEAKFAPNAPDVAPDPDASITATTGSAFITSSGNIYSFQAPINLQLDDTTDLEVRSVFVQLASLGSGLDRDGARLLMDDGEGGVRVVRPARTFVASEEELTGERGGIGTTYGLQWDLRDTPLTGSYTLLLGAASSSLSIDRVSLDLSETFAVIRKPEPLSVTVHGDLVKVSWFGNRQLQSSDSLDSGWTTVPGSELVNEMTFPVGSGAKLFRLVTPEATSSR
jgi:hypothetical protein